MPSLSEIRQKYPMYNDMSDKDFADAFHQKYYSDIPVNDFYKKIEFAEQPQPQESSGITERQAAMGVGAAIKGAGAIPAMIADVPYYAATGAKELINIPLEAATGKRIPDMGIPSPSEKYNRTITKDYGFPEPTTPNERLAADVISGAATGGTMGLGTVATGVVRGAASGASSALAGGVAREVGANAWVQFLASMAGGFGPQMVENAVKSVGSKAASAISPSTSIAGKKLPIDSEGKIIEAMKPAREAFKKLSGEEKALWTKFNETVPVTSRVNPSAVSDMAKNVRSSILSNNVNLESEAMDGVKSALQKLSELVPKQAIDNATGLPIISKTTNQATLGKLIAVRQELSAASMGNAGAKKILDAFDDSLMQQADNLLASGDTEASKLLLSAISKTREKYKRFGTEIGSGQRKSFEQFITKDATSDTEAVKAFGSSTTSTVQAPQLIERMIKEGGDSARVNLGKSYFDRAIQNSMEYMEDGRTVINPMTLRKELANITEKGADAGGIGKEIRGMIYTKKELDEMKRFMEIIKDPKSMPDKIRESGRKIPLLDMIISDPKVIAGLKTKKQVYEYLNSGIIEAQDKFGVGTISTIEALKNFNTKGE